MTENSGTTPMEPRESARSALPVVSSSALGPPRKPQDLNRPQRMLGVVLWIALLAVVVWLRVGAR